MIIAGIDFSMSCPAICVYDTSKELTFKNCKFFYLIGQKSKVGSFKNMHGFEHSEYACSEERFNNISDWAMSVLKAAKVKRVCLEGYSFGSRSSSMTNIAENTGVLKHKMWKEGIDFIIPAPTTIKKHFSGKGNANKQMMYESGREFDKTIPDVLELYNWKIDASPMADIVDSYAMVHYLIDYMKSE